MKRKQPDRSKQAEAQTRPFWSGTITFGLVSVPVELYPAIRSTHVGLRMLGSEGKPLSRRYFSSRSGRELDDSDLVNGFEIKKNKFVVITDDELEKLAPEKSRDIALKQFVQLSAIPPMYFEHPYFLAPASGSLKAYRLLAAVMEKSGQAGIATFVMRGKAYLVAIIAEDGILRAETMRFSDELRAPAAVGLPKPAAVAKAAVHKFEKQIRSRERKALLHDVLHDERSAKIQKYVEKKRRTHRKEVVATEAPKPKPAEVVDLMTILKKSLQDKKAKAA